MKINKVSFMSNGTNLQMPVCDRNYCLFDNKKVDSFVSQKEAALPELGKIIATSMDEKQVVEALYTVDRMIDDGVKNVDKLYPALSRFNDSKSPNIQTFLAGIYRKTLVPDGFGPLVKMLIQNSINPQKDKTFDPNEEIGGAVLEYIRAYGKNKVHN